MDAFWGKSAQHMGVAKVRQKPQRITCSGAFAHGILAKAFLRSKVFITMGGMTVTENGFQFKSSTKFRQFLKASIKALRNNSKKFWFLSFF
jgi:hypothetical protein